jgi:Glycosyl transferases group 1
MNIGIPVARFHPGNTGEYAQRAFVALGHSATVLSPAEFFQALPGKKFDYFFCVDSSEALPLHDPAIAGRSLRKVGFWFIDYRHNKDRKERVPNDFENARILQERDGWIFQSQFEDFEDCLASGITRVSWLPLAADQHIWTSEPSTEKEFHIGFVGNVWDVQRKRALEMLLRSPSLRVGFAGQGSIWKEDAAALLRKCMVGFNINTFFGQPVAYDVNMRAFETLSCGLPLFTNDVPSLKRVFPPDAPFIRTYTSLTDMMPRLLEAFKDQTFLNSGAEARQWILDHATYEHRMRDVLNRLA